MTDWPENEEDEPRVLTAHGANVLFGTLERIEQKLDQLLGIEEAMAVDQATFDAALLAFTTDLSAGIAAIEAKAAGTGLDLTAELGQITTAQAAFDAAVTQVAPPVVPPAPVVPPVA